MKSEIFSFFGKSFTRPATSRLAQLPTKAALVALLLNFIGLRVFAQAPLVYTSENTGAASCAAPPLPSLAQLPVIAPLPDPFLWADGHGRTTNFSDWECRRNEIRAQIENYEIGKKPARPQNITASYTPTSATAGTLTVNITVNGKTATLTSQVTLPSGTGPFAAMIGMNSPTGSVPASVFAGRSVATIQYNHNQVTTYYNPQLTDPFYQLYPDQNLSNSGQYAAWSWGVSRLIDGLELVQASLPIDLKHIGVTGCSYAGKMALFAGAFDERIALTIAQESGGGGAPAWRVSETLGAVEKLGATDYNWFKDDMKQFADANVSKLPEDHHELMAMVAPRALLVTGNTDFEWLANPAAYVSARATHEVYKTFGLGDRFGFYIDGGHNHCAVPAAQIPVMQAFVDKFLLGNTSANTNVTVNPYPTLDYQRWYKWWGTATPILPPLPPEPLGKRYWLETECATVGSSWDIVADTSAAHGAYAKVKTGLSSPNAAPTGAASYLTTSFNADSAGTYNILARLSVPAGEDYSYWLQLDNGAFQLVGNQLAANPGFENGLTGWTTLNSNGATISADALAADAHSGSGSMKVVNPTAQPGNQWKVQVSSTAFPTTIGKQYTISYWVRAAAAGGSIRLSTGPSSAQYQADQAIGTAWQQVTWTITASLVSTTFLFDMGQVANTYYIDDVSVKEVGAADGWRWVKLKDAPLTIGTHTLTIGYGSGGNAKLDKLLVTTYSGTITGKGGDADNCKTQQTITFGALPNKLFGDPDFTLAATASSGLPVTYTTSDTTIATITNGVVRLRKVGTVTITAKQTGNATYAAAPVVSQVLTIVPVVVKVQYKDYDNGRMTDAYIKPQLRLDNQGTTAVPYDGLTARYWLTAENYSTLSTAIDYAVMGTGQVHARYVPLAQPRAGAWGYVEYTFDASLGNLAAGGNSGDIYSNFHNMAWGNLDESDDYSHGANLQAYTLNDHITLYRNGRLVWGTEPAAATATTALEVWSQNWTSYPRTTNLNTQLQVRNTGNQPIDYSGLTVRYWFSPEGTASLTAGVTWAQMGASNMQAQVGKKGTEMYLETGFAASMGQLYPGSTTGEIYESMHKSDWSVFIEDNDYSYRAPGAYAPNNHITAYYQGQLVYGTEPAGAASTSTIASTSATTMQIAVLGNPVEGSQAQIAITGISGEDVQLELLDFQGNSVATKQIDNVVDGQTQLIPMPAYSGVYLLKVVSESQTSVIRLLKQ